jgi:hypothetical protein
MRRKERRCTCRVLQEMYLNAAQREKNWAAGRGAGRGRALLSRVKRSPTVQDHLLEMLLAAS